MTSRKIYLDYAATTPVDPLVRDAMLPYLGSQFGNPSSVHQWGQDVRRAIDRARDAIADSIHCHSSEVFFTSGGTEADNTAVIGILLAGKARGRDHVVTTAVEHHAILDSAKFAADTLGFSLTVVPVDPAGQVSPEAIAEVITDRTALVSVMHGNNEIGTIQPISEIAEAAHERGAYFHTDAVQTFGQLPIDVEALGADLLTLSAHKIYGPKGIGALYIRKGVRITPLLHGGQQEREKRPGTENAAGIVGFDKAVELLAEWRDSEAVRLCALRDSFLTAICERFPDAVLNGHPTDRLPNNLNISFPGADSESLLLSLDLHGIAASSGSACASGAIEPSHVLKALGLPLPVGRAAVRFSLGRHTTADDIACVVEKLGQIVPATRI